MAIAAMMMMVRPSLAQSCSDTTVSTQAELDTAITNYNTFCGNGDSMTIDLAGNTITYATGLTLLNNATTAKLFIKDGTLDANSQGRVLFVVDGDITFDTMLLTGGTGANGGAIQLQQDTNGTLINTTVTGNTSSTAAAILNNGGTLTLTNTTVSTNTITDDTTVGSVWNRLEGSTPVLNLNNSIIANTFDSGGAAIPDCRNDSGTVNFSPGQSNLIEQDQAGGVACDLAGTNTLSGDPSLGLLQDNGGQSNTLALLPSSTAINAGNNAVCAAAPVNNLDQRGVTRPQGSVCDIGAFEFEGFGSLSIVKAADPEDGTDFAFTSDIAGGGSFTLDVDSDGTYADTITFADTPIGTYAITELVPQNWQLDSASCTGGSDSGSLNDATLTVVLGADEAITCTFSNEKLGTITVKKEVSNAADAPSGV
ncbi:MAG: hypothetical protein KDJ99_27805, partial [Candidatus Competibacteraceae bacterium]|nr:hypothetical protein [Candidatus Competibacteraceae bacterium]